MKNRRMMVLLFSLLTIHCSLFTAYAEIIDRIVAVVNDNAITLSELNAAAGAVGIKGSGTERQQPIIEAKGRILDQLIERKLVEYAATKAGITVSEKEIDNAVDDVRKQNNIGQEELLKALAGSGLTYREYREQLKDQIRQVKFTNREFRSNIRIDSEDVAAYYMQNKDRYAGPAARRLRIISLLLDGQNSMASIEKKIKEIFEMIKKGDDFSRIARQYSQGANAADGGDLGYIRTGEMDAPIEKAAADLKEGATSNIIRTATGYHIVQLVEVKKSEPRPLPEVEEEIRNVIYQRIVDEKYKLWLEEIKKRAHIEVRL